jgi:peptidoglycan/LPS O-acetylase OafA/YrhL
VLTTQNGAFLYLGGFDAIDVAVATILLAVLDGAWRGKWLFNLRPFIALGLVSYAFYLWHLPVFFGIRHFDTHWDYPVRVIVAFSVTLGLTLLSWFILERPLMRWRKRLEAKRIAEREEPDRPRPAAGNAEPERLTDQTMPVPSPE